MRSASASIRARASWVPRTLSSTARRPSREISAVSRTSLATSRAFSVVSATVWRTSSVVAVVSWIAVSSWAAPVACCAVAARMPLEAAGDRRDRVVQVARDGAPEHPRDQDAEEHRDARHDHERARSTAAA